VKRKSIKLNERQLRDIANDESRRIVTEDAFLHGVPEWALRQDVSEFVDNIKHRITQFIQLNKSQNSSDQRESIAAMNDVCDDLEKKLYDTLENGLYDFIRRV
jgi:cell division septum initiation protein DivIVA